MIIIIYIAVIIFQVEDAKAEFARLNCAYTSYGEAQVTQFTILGKSLTWDREPDINWEVISNNEFSLLAIRQFMEKSSKDGSLSPIVDVIFFDPKDGHLQDMILSVRSERV